MFTLGVCLGCAAVVALLASDFAAAAEAPDRGNTVKAPAVDAAAMAALDRMGAELRSHKLLSIKSEVTAEDVLASGQKLQYSGTLQILAGRPNRFRITAISDQQAREIFYNGQSVTVFSPRLGYYASFAAPPTIYEAVQKASADYDIELPLADLFTWGTEKSDAAKITSAFFVALEHVGGRSCNHYAFRQKHVDWEVWIQQSGPPLPCKLVITNRDDPSMPQYAAALHWSFPGLVADTIFTFVPPPKAHQIVFVSAGKTGAR